MGIRACLALTLCLGQTIAAPPLQIPLRTLDQAGDASGPLVEASKRRPLHGRFLQITDFHPDPFYQIYSSTAKDDACHHGQGPAGIYGAETSECDSPLALVNQTMDWIRRELRDKIDFVIWTGDSARHDNDDDIPRSEEQVLKLNRMMVRKMGETFGKHNGDEEDDNPNNDHVVPIVPTFGNNDILPHNIMRPGPNKWTRDYAHLWRQFIPEEQKHQFEQGGWFYVEVIPHQLAVFSLNTLFFFNRNAAADGCAQPSEPGYQQMEWLRIQLQFLRDRSMKAILIGHVPPTRQDSKTAWEETCWQKYTLWLRQYRDIIISSHYGHFNYDHMILQDFEHLRKGTKKGKMPDYEASAAVRQSAAEGDEFHAAVSSSYFIELREAWSDIPTPPDSLDLLETESHDSISACNRGDLWCQFSNLLPNRYKESKKEKKKRKDKEKKFLEEIGGEYAERYAASFVSASVVPNLFPTIRIYEYNITGLQRSRDLPIPTPPEVPWPRDNGDEAGTLRKKKYKFDLPDGPSKSAPPGPAYSPQTLSLLRYKQYLANLTYINNDFASNAEDVQDDDLIDALKWREGKHKGKKPHDKDHTPQPKKFGFELHYDTHDDDVYQLKDLTMPNLVDLARRISNFIPEDELAAAEGNEAVDSDSELEDASEDVEIETKKGKKKGKKDKKKKKKARRDQNKAWYTFVERAYVETLDEEQLRDEFGS